MGWIEAILDREGEYVLVARKLTSVLLNNG
jgi:hypothetical protein